MTTLSHQDVRPSYPILNIAMPSMAMGTLFLLFANTSWVFYLLIPFSLWFGWALFMLSLRFILSSFMNPSYGLLFKSYHKTIRYTAFRSLEPKYLQTPFKILLKTQGTGTRKKRELWIKLPKAPWRYFPNDEARLEKEISQASKTILPAWLHTLQTLYFPTEILMEISPPSAHEKMAAHLPNSQ